MNLGCVVAGAVLEVDNRLTIDASRRGNVSRFLNHACAPNIQVITATRGQSSVCMPCARLPGLLFSRSVGPACVL